MKNKNIILIGFMGVGKGTTARALVKASDMYAVDTDDLIESLENRKIKKIFENDGEEYFRNLEKKTAKWLEKNVKNSIISTGGGFYKVPNLKKIGKVIYLKSSFDAILEKIYASPNAKKKIKKRPLLNDRKKAKELFDMRTKEYEKVADITIDIKNLSIDKVIENILKQL
jgi:shikimate kinase